MVIPTSISLKLPRHIPLLVAFSRYSLSFNGVNSYLEVSHSPSLDFSGSPITVEAYVYPRSHAGYREIVRKGAVSNTEFTCEINNGYLRFDFYDGGGWNTHQDASTLLPLNRWSRVAWVYDNTRVKMYVNGIEIYNAAETTPITGRTNPIHIGCLYSGGTYYGPFDGLINEILLYNQARSLAELRYNMLNYANPIRSGLVLWLRMEEGAGLTAYDRSGYGNHASLLPAGSPPSWTRDKMWELRAEAGL